MHASLVLDRRDELATPKPRLLSSSPMLSFLTYMHKHPVSGVVSSSGTVLKTGCWIVHRKQALGSVALMMGKILGSLMSCFVSSYLLLATHHAFLFHFVSFPLLGLSLILHTHPSRRSHCRIAFILHCDDARTCCVPCPVSKNNLHIR